MDQSHENAYSENGEAQHRQGSVRPRQMSISSDEVNYLIYRYLQECGFVHSAYTFSHESMLLSGGAVGGPANSLGSGTTVGVSSSNAPQLPNMNSLHPQRTSWQRIADKSLPPGALISFLQKGLQYIGIEESLLRQQEGTVKNSSNNMFPVDFSLLSPSSVQSLTRRHPPILLTVPPAAAAAAVRARLESELEMNNELSFAGQVISGIRQSSTSSAIVSDNRHIHGQESVVIGPQSQLYQQADPKNLTASVRQEGVDDTSNVGAKRTLSGHKRGGKKQKTGESSDVMGRTTSPFVSSEQARITLDGTKSMSQISKSEQDAASSSEIISSARPIDAPVDRLPYLPNGYDNSHHEYSKKNGGQLIENGELKGDSIHRKGQVGVSTSNDSSSTAATSNEKDEKYRANNKDTDRIDGDPVNGSTDDDLIAAKPEEVLQLIEHQSEVFMCAWNPVFTNLIATGSGDASARIWEMNDKYANAGLKHCIELPHGIESGDRKKKDVTTLEWSVDGLRLATGSYDGFARVWDRKGVLIHTLRGHNGPIFSLKWNRSGTFLLSGSYDKTIIVWNLSVENNENGDPGQSGATTSFIEHQFKNHEAPALDVDWKDDSTFASCSSDMTVHIYNVNIETPIKVYKGHTDEVNAVKWSPSGKYLASCSDDCTAKVWEVDSDRDGPVYDFVSHDQEIYTIKWSPTGPGSLNTSKQLLLATASFDGSIRIWNIQDGSCYGYFNRHRESVYSVAFSPSGDYLSSGSLAGQMYIWDVAKGVCIKSFKGSGDIFEVAWNKEETRVAACFSSNVVALIDFSAPSRVLTASIETDLTNMSSSSTIAVIPEQTSLPTIASAYS